jgi:hypothetical protein
MSAKVLMFLVGFFLICIALSATFSILSRTKTKTEGFTDTQPPAQPTEPTTDCGTIPLSAYDAPKVQSYLSKELQYAISMYSTGMLNFHKQIKDLWLAGSAEQQMAIAALLGRYLAFNGGSAAVPGPGYNFTSNPGNYTTQISGATELLNPTKPIDKTSPLYPSFKAATAVALCTKPNKGWVSTADFPKTLPPLSHLYQYATPNTGILPGPRINHNAVN